MTTPLGVTSGFKVGSRRGALIAGVAGVLWPALSMVRLPLTRGVNQPPWTESPDAIASYYAHARFDVSFALGVGVTALAYVLLIVFVAKVADLLGGHDRGSRWVAYFMVGAVAVDVGLIIGYLATFATAVFWGSHGGLGADGYLVLGGLSWAFYWLDMIPLALWLMAFGVGVVATGLFPRWLGWAILADAGAIVLSFMLPSSTWDVTTGIPYLLVLIAGGFMLMRPERYSAVGARGVA